MHKFYKSFHHFRDERKFGNILNLLVNRFLLGGRLTQKLIVDAALKIEANS